jgi:hypothetical protein
MFKFKYNYKIENSFFDNDESLNDQIPYGEYSLKGAIARQEIDESQILAKSIVEFRNNGDSVYIQTSSQENSAILDNSKPNLFQNRKDLFVHDLRDHGVKITDLYSLGVIKSISASEGEETMISRYSRILNSFETQAFKIKKVSKLIYQY